MRKTLIASVALIAFAAVPVIAQQAPKPSGAPLGGDSAGSATKSVLPADGEGLYRATCQACHMADGRGGVGAGTIPSLAGNPKLASAAYPIVMAAQGRGAMPGFVDIMSPAQISAVVGYVCTHFGNKCAGDSSPAAVKRIVAGVQHRPAP